MSDDAHSAAPSGIAIAADLVCPATGARLTGEVTALSVDRATVRLPEGQAPDGMDIGATVEATFVSSVLGGSRAVPSRIRRLAAGELELQFVSQTDTPPEALFNRRGSLRLQPEALPLGRECELAWGTHDQVRGVLDDISMTGVAILLPLRSPWPEVGEQVRVRMSGQHGLTVWISGAVRHRALRHRDRRLGIAFDLRIADVEGAGPALRELVRQIERLQMDELVLAFAGIGPQDRPLGEGP